MTGSQSLSIAQLRTIAREAERQFPSADGPSHYLDGVHVRTDEQRDDQIGVPVGTVVGVVIHQSLLRGDGRKRVQFNRAYADSITIGILRDGGIIPSSQAA